MKAVSVKDKGDIQFEELPIPEPGPRMPFLKALYCSICGSKIQRLHCDHRDTTTEAMKEVL